MRPKTAFHFELLNLTFISRTLSIWTYQAVQSPKGWLINGVAIHGHPKAILPADGPLKVFWKILRSYFYKSAGNVKIDVLIDSKTYAITTDDDGNFVLRVEFDRIDSIEFLHANSSEKLDVLQKETRFFSYCTEDFLVISDIDDTILVSHSARFFSKLWLMLFKPIPNRKTVEESELAYRELKKGNVPFAYVSASEYNLYSLVSTFIHLHELPLGPIYLRSHQEFKDLFGKTERENYKVDRIKKLLAHFPERKIVLFGDDSQQDFTVFGEVAQEVPDRIHSVFLRKTGSLKVSKKGKVTWEMPGGKIPVHYYDDYADIQLEIKKLIDENSGNSQSHFRRK